MLKIKRFALITLTAGFIFILSCKTHFDTTKDTFKATNTNEAFERGKNLAYNICAQCHYDKATAKFSGIQMHDIPSSLGEVYSANLTRSASNGLPPHYTDAELKYLLKTGIAKDGRFLAYMLRPNLADEDINAIIDFLRSDDPSVAPENKTVGVTHLNLLGKIGTSYLGKPAPYVTGLKRPSDQDKVAMGRYLVDNIGCYHCHSKSFTSLNYLHPEESKKYLEGGLKFKGPADTKIYASNLTPDKETGIGNYTNDQFRKAVKEGEAPDRKLHPPMPQFQHLTDQQVDAIYSYLQSIPPKMNKVR